MEANTGEYFGRYELIGENVNGYYYPGGYRPTAGTVTAEEHRQRLDQVGLRHLITKTGLTAFRSTLKHMYNAGQLELIATIQPFNKEANEIYAVEWVALS